MDSSAVRLAFISRLDERGKAFAHMGERIRFTQQFYKEMGSKSTSVNKNIISGVYKNIKADVVPTCMREDENQIRMFYRVIKIYRPYLLTEEKLKPKRKSSSSKAMGKKERFRSFIAKIEESERKKPNVEPVDTSGGQKTPIREELERMKYASLKWSDRFKKAVREREKKIYYMCHSIVRRIDEFLKIPNLPATRSEIGL